jgi:hypothetical protein
VRMMKKIKQKTILIALSRGILIRNFFRSGVITKLLERGFRVVVLTPYKELSVEEEFCHPNLIFDELVSTKNKRFRKIFEEFSKGAVFNETVHARYKFSDRFSGEKPSTLLYITRMLFLVPLRHVLGFKRFLRLLEERVNPSGEHDYVFEKYKPDLVLNASAGENFGILKSAKRLGVTTIDMPKSWDNSSKLLYRVKADYIFVWSEFMKRQVMNFQDYKEEEIRVVGIPQYDVFAQKRGLMTREAFCEGIGFDPAKKIILHASTGGACHNEDDYPALLKEYIDKGVLKDVQVFVRPHVKYLDDVARYKKRVGGSKDFYVDEGDVQDAALKDNWDISEHHMTHLLNSLYHSDVCLNIASTVTLDATACGTPVININFDIKKMPEMESVNRFYHSDYVKAAHKTGGTWLVESEGEFKEALHDILERGEKREKERERMIEYIMHKNDGRSAERMVEALEEIAK